MERIYNRLAASFTLLVLRWASVGCDIELDFSGYGYQDMLSILRIRVEK